MKDKLTNKQRLIWLLPLAIILTFINQCKAQDNISIGLYQDARLLFLGDDRGNNPGTIDAKLDISLQGYQLNNYYFELRTQLEYANLKGGDYASIMVIPNWVFGNDLELSSGVILGFIHRWKQSFLTYGLNLDMSYYLFDKLKISILGQYIKRNDLNYLWNDKSFKPNVYIGVKYNLK